MKFSIKRINKDVLLSDEAYKRIIETISWKIEPVFVCEGRTAALCLENYLDYENVKYSTIKLKGVGGCHPKGCALEPWMTKPFRPTTIPYLRAANHFGIDENGDIVNNISTPAPLGGICLENALREYDNAQLLSRNKVPSILPYLVIQYDDMYFKNSPLGAVVSLCPSENPSRFLNLSRDEMIWTDREKSLYKTALESFHIEGGVESLTARLTLMKEIGRQYGRLIRGLSDSGLYRHSGGWENIQFDGKRSVFFLTDLDTAMMMSDLPQKYRKLHYTRNIISCIYHFINQFFHKDSLKDFPITLHHEYNVIFEILKGFFCDYESELSDISRIIWDYCTPVIRSTQEYQEKTGDFETRDQFSKGQMFFYTFIFRLLYPLVLNADPRPSKEGLVSVTELDERIKKYSEEIWEKIQRICLFIEEKDNSQLTWS